MKVTIPLELLKKRLSFVTHAISTRSPLPILTNILLDADAQGLTISGTDLEIGMQVKLQATIDEEGATTVPARTFSELIHSLSGEDITLLLKESVLEVTSSKTKSVFQTIPATEFPKLYEEQGTHIATFPTTAITRDLTALLFATSSETTRPALSGVLFRKEGGGLLLVATDGYRLSLRRQGSQMKFDEKSIVSSLIVPSRVLKEVVAMRDEGEEVKVYIEKDANQILFILGSMTLVGRLIEAEFPPFEKIIPQDHTSEIRFAREELQNAVKICSIFARDSANIIKFSLSPTKLTVSSQTPSLGENTVEVDATLTGEENEIAFNARYLLDVLGNLPSSELLFQMTGPLNPGVFKMKDDNSFLHLIMPIRIQQ